MTEDIKVKTPPKVEDLDRKAYTVGVSFKETVVTGLQILAENEDHAKVLADEILRGREDGEVTDIKVFDAYEIAKAQAIFQKNQEDVLEQLEAAMVEAEEEKEPTVN